VPSVKKKKMELYGIARQITDDNRVGRMLFACCITKAIDTHSEYVLLIAFPWQNCSHDRSPMFLYTTFSVLLLIAITGLRTSKVGRHLIR